MKEKVLRYRILRHEEIPVEYKEECRSRGIDPDNNWVLIWSFDRREDAEAMLKKYLQDPHKPDYYQYKLVDGGGTTYVDVSEGLF